MRVDARELAPQRLRQRRRARRRASRPCTTRGAERDAGHAPHHEEGRAGHARVVAEEQRLRHRHAGGEGRAQQRIFRRARQADGEHRRTVRPQHPAPRAARSRRPAPSSAGSRRPTAVAPPSMRSVGSPAAPREPVAQPRAAAPQSMPAPQPKKSVALAAQEIGQHHAMHLATRHPPAAPGGRSGTSTRPACPWNSRARRAAAARCPPPCAARRRTTIFAIETSLRAKPPWSSTQAACIVSSRPISSSIAAWPTSPARSRCRSASCRRTSRCLMRSIAISSARRPMPRQRMQCVSRAVPRRICVSLQPVADAHQHVLVGDLEPVEVQLAMPAMFLRPHDRDAADDVASPAGRRGTGRRSAPCGRRREVRAIRMKCFASPAPVMKCLRPVMRQRSLPTRSARV